MAVSAGEVPTIERPLRSRAVAVGLERVGTLRTSERRPVRDASDGDRRGASPSSRRGHARMGPGVACGGRGSMPGSAPHAPSVVGRLEHEAARAPPVRIKSSAHARQPGRSAVIGARARTHGGRATQRTALTGRWCAPLDLRAAVLDVLGARHATRQGSPTRRKATERRRLL